MKNALSWLLLSLCGALACSHRAVPSESAAVTLVEKRIGALIRRMTLEEKVSLIGGTGLATKPIERLKIPELRMTDGPMGVRVGAQTAFPAGIAMAASFNPGLIEDIAKAMGDETRKADRHMLLGPCVNLSRHPFGGRNFESFGEDPFLSSRLTYSYVLGLQSRNVLASVKHYALNEQEIDRMTSDSRPDTRTFFEMHMPMFEAAIAAGAWSVMASYNKVDGLYATENRRLLTEILKERAGFRGFVVSDWGATKSTIGAALAGLDLEMPYGTHFNETLIEAVRRGQVAESVVDDKVRRILRAMFAIGLIDPAMAPTLPPPRGPDSPEHQALARLAAREGMVLLKNEGQILPLRPQIRSVALIGPNAHILRSGGGGSSKVRPFREISPKDALQEYVKTHPEFRHVTFRFERGVELPGELYPIPSQFYSVTSDGKQRGIQAEYFGNTELQGDPHTRQIDLAVDHDFDLAWDPRFDTKFSARWTGYLVPPETGRYRITLVSDDGSRLKVAGREVISMWRIQTREHGMGTAEVQLKKGVPTPIVVEYFQDTNNTSITLGWELLRDRKLEIAAAVKAAKAADVALVFAGLGNDIESENKDRTTMDLPDGQVDLIRAVAKANPKTVVILHGGNPMTMEPWLKDVAGVIHAWYPGQEGGAALAELIFGQENFSGKLPVTLLKRWSDSPAFGDYPGDGRVRYQEGVFLGYRHFDGQKKDPHFEFGYGLSYTTFAMSDLSVQKAGDSGVDAKTRWRLRFKVTNTGRRPGAEIAQVYVGEVKPKVPRPVRELKGFRRVDLKPGESQWVEMDLDRSAFAHFDANSLSWKVNPGSFRVEVGSSSRRLPLAQVVEIAR